MKNPAFLLILCVGSVSAATVHSPLVSGSIQQHARCGVVAVTGNVTINCPGIDPAVLRALEQRFEKLLTEGSIREEQLAGKVEEWKQRYFDLAQRLTESGLSHSQQERAEQLLRQNRLEEAGKVLDELLESLEPGIERTAKAHFDRGALYELQFEPLHALAHYELAYRYRPTNFDYASSLANVLYGQREFERAEAIDAELLKRVRGDQSSRGLQLTAALLKRQSGGFWQEARFGEAINALSESIRMYEKLPDGSTPAYQAQIAESLANLCSLYVDTARFEEAAHACVRSVTIYRRSVRIYPSVAQIHSTDARGLAFALTNLALLFDRIQKFPESDDAFQVALKIGRDLAEVNPSAYGPALVDILTNNGVMLVHASRFAEAIEKYLEALHRARELAKNNPDAYSLGVATLTNNIGAAYAGLQRWEEAEAAYEEALAIRRQRMASHARGAALDLATTLANLSSLEQDQGRLRDALAHNDEALSIFRGLQQEDAAAFDRYVAGAVNNSGNIYRRMQRFDEAERAFVEALALYRKLVREHPPAFTAELAAILVNTGALYGTVGKFPESAAVLEEARQLYRRLAADNPTVYSQKESDVSDMLEVARMMRKAT